MRLGKNMIDYATVEFVVVRGEVRRVDEFINHGGYTDEPCQFLCGNECILLSKVEKFIPRFEDWKK